MQLFHDEKIGGMLCFVHRYCLFFMTKELVPLRMGVHSCDLRK